MRWRTLFLLLFVSAVPGYADTLLTLKSHVDSFQLMGETTPAKDTEVKVWIGADRIRRDDGQVSSIVRLDRNRVYIVRHEDKTYSEIALPIDLRKLAPQGAEAVVDQMANAMKLTARVTPTEETRKIGSWNTRKVQAAITSAMGMKMDVVLWVSPEVEAHKSFNRMAATLAALQPGAAAWAAELERIAGFPVLQESTVDVVGTRFKTREELVSVETRDAPAGLYEPPGGYKQQPFNPLAQPGS